MPQDLQIARVLRSSNTGFVAGCRVSQLEVPALGELVRSPVAPGYQVFGIIHNISINDDGLVRQLVAAEHVSDEIIRDNRERRIVPVELSVLAVGYEQSGRIFHLLPTRPPLSLDEVFLCDEGELLRFTSSRRLGYLRHIVLSEAVPVAEVLAAHIRRAGAVRGDGGLWRQSAVREIITLLRDDYPSLIAVLGALNELLASEDTSP